MGFCHNFSGLKNGLKNVLKMEGKLAAGHPAAAAVFLIGKEAALRLVGVCVFPLETMFFLVFRRMAADFFDKKRAFP